MKKTVIIQGKVHEWTQKNINAFKNFGGYRIIFSTWKGEENVPTGCEVVFLEDPGSGPIQNFSRQLKGFNGVADVEKGFLVKTRSDMVHMIDPHCLFESIKVEKNDFCLFDYKLFINNIMTIDPRIAIPGEGKRNFSITDWVLFGKTSDVKKWYEINDSKACKYVKCCEQIFTLSNFLKTKASRNLKIEEFNHEESFNMFLNFLETNFVVKNTYTTLQSFCAKYQQQPENLPFYIKESTKLGDLR